MNFLDRCKEFLGCPYCGQGLGWRWKGEEPWRDRPFPGPCPCRPLLVYPGAKQVGPTVEWVG